jgi:molybdopterin molybdotransferase
MPGREWENPEAMLSVEAAREQVLAAFSPLPPVSVPLLDALGLVVADDIVADVFVPPFRNSAMDGFAIRSIESADASVTLAVVTSVAAGDIPGVAIGPGEAARIMTGAPVPDGADAVVRFEETDEGARDDGNPTVTIHRRIQPDENVRAVGEDIRPGMIAIPRETRLRPSEIGVLASLDVAAVSVHRRPRVAILATGDEVVELGDPLRPGQVRNTNSYIVSAIVQREGGETTLLGIARDSISELSETLASAGTPDLIVTSGGVSVGDYDMVKEVLRERGSVDVWQVRMKPGKPLAFGTIGGVPLLGLPGNPFAALVAFEQFGVPALRRMLGRADLDHPVVTATLADRIENRGGRRHFIRGALEWTDDGYTVHRVGGHGSALLSGFIESDCFIVVPEIRDVLEAGELVKVQIISR